MDSAQLNGSGRVIRGDLSHELLNRRIGIGTLWELINPPSSSGRVFFLPKLLRFVLRLLSGISIRQVQGPNPSFFWILFRHFPGDIF